MKKFLTGVATLAILTLNVETAGAQPVNDDCADALVINLGTIVGTTAEATNDGLASCGSSLASPDVWFRYVVPFNQFLVANTFGSEFNTVVSLHTGCPGDGGEITCNDDIVGVESGVHHFVATGAEVFVRVAGYEADSGPFSLTLGQSGVIQGLVSDAATGIPVADADVNIYNEEGRYITGGESGSSGRFSFNGIQPGDHFVTVTSDGFVGELYNDIPCFNGICDPTTGTPIPVSLNTVHFGIDFGLDFGATISGTVRNVGGEPVQGFVRVWNTEGDSEGAAFTNSSGEYSIDGLNAGDHFVTASDGEHQDEVWDGIPCPLATCDPTTGTPIALIPGAQIQGIDFALEPLGVLSGRVTNAATGEPIADLEIEVLSEGFGLERVRKTNATGDYSIKVDTGTFFVRTRRSSFLSEIYDDLPCPNGFCSVEGATPIVVTLGETTPGIDFALDLGGSITGTVTDTDGVGLVDVDVRITDVSGSYFETTSTDAMGRYAVRGLVSGNYFLLTSGASPYVDERYDDLPCVSRNCTGTSATPIVVTAGETTAGIDFVLDLGGSITGTVTDETGDPLAHGGVRLVDADGFYVTFESTDAMGRYTVQGLPAGTYYLVSQSVSHLPEVYDDVPCLESDCDPTIGTPLVVTLGETIANIDFVLTPLAAPTCVPSATALCLNDNRFRVEVEWRDFVGQVGAGEGVELTDDSGYFWFFSPGNVELVVKVLDACSEPFDRFWVFAGGLTDVATELTVTDTLTGAVQSYSHALGTEFAPVQDLDAFATCAAEGRPAEGRPAEGRPAEGRPAEGRPGSVPRAAIAGLEPDALTFPRAPSTPVTTQQRYDAVDSKAILICTPSATTLCLHDGRFIVSAEWDTGEQTGAAQAVPLTGDTGTFWFFSPDNVEVVVKVLDACDVGGFDNFWVFAAGLTDVRVTLKVTDGYTLRSQEWVNPLGEAFQPIRETGGFPGCP